MKSLLNKELDEIVTIYENSPHWRFMNLKTRIVKQGEVSLELKPRKELLNVNGTVHGGIYASILDTTMGITVRTLVNGSVITLHLNVQYVKSVTTDQLIYSIGNVISKGKTTFLIEGKLYNESDELLAHSTGTFKVIK